MQFDFVPCSVTIIIGFLPEKIAHYGDAEVNRLLGNANIVRNRLKITAAVKNAVAYLSIMETTAGFADYLWQFVEGRPVLNHWKLPDDVPSSSAGSDIMSRALKSRGFSFVGTTICYAFMQAVGMVNDHVIDCYRHKEIIEQWYRPEWK